MFCITVAVGNSSWRLLYRDEAKADQAYLELTIAKTAVQIDDDFDQKFFGIPNGILFENLDKTKHAAMELMLHQARIQQGAQKLAQTDPALRAGGASQSPAILHPMGNGARPF